MARRAYVDTPEGQMHYMTEGEGEPLVLLHQGCRSSRMYVKLMPLLSSEHRVIAMDLMGFGNSDAGPAENPSVPDRARNVFHFLEALGIDSCHVFGLHTGAAMGAELAAGWPEKVATLTLFGFPFIRGDNERQEIYAYLERTTGLPPPHMSTDWLPMEITPDGTHLTVIWARIYSEVLRYWLHSTPPWTTELHPSPVQSVHRWATPEILEFIERWTLDFLQQMAGNIRPPLLLMTSPNRSRRRNVPSSDFYDVKPRLSLIQAPTLLIDADSPYEVSTCKRSKEVQSFIPGSKSVTLPDSDDNAAEFRAPQLADMMLDFLRQHRQ